jgi:hypothetical protein
MPPCPEIIHHWWQWHLSVGLAAVSLAAVGVLVPWFRGEVKKTRERAFWSTVLFFFVGLELWAIRRSDIEHEEELQHSWCVQEQRFDQIHDESQRAAQKATDGVEKMEQLIESARQIALTTKDSLAQETGAHEFCYLFAGGSVGKTSDGKIIYGLAVAAYGELPLEHCHVRILENRPIVSSEDFNRQMAGRASKELGPLTPGKIRGGNGVRFVTTGILLPEGSYYVQITTRNDLFYEMLDIHSVPGQALNKIQIRDDSWKIIYSEPAVSPQPTK